MICEYCGTGEVVAKGLCAACYSRARKHGGNPARVKIRAEVVCTSCGVTTDQGVKGLCRKCYQRWLRHGHTDQTRPEDWGSREKHPLYHSWSWLKRCHKTKAAICDEWSNFWVFVKDVGARPGGDYFLRRPKEWLPFSRTNFEWRRKDVTFQDLDVRTQRAAYARRYRTEAPEKVKNAALKKAFGITYADFMKMHLEQGGVCAICGQPEKGKIKGKILDLAVDHCHTSGRIRGLLCHKCNRALGLFEDTPERLRAAAAYLERHQQ